MTCVNEVMSTDVQLIEPDATLRRAAQLMQELDVGALPVCRGNVLLCMVTDRDITVRGVAARMSPDTARVSEVMTDKLQFCTEDQDSAEVMRTMGEAQVRRLPVVSRDKELVGIVSIGDLARRQVGHIDQAAREISEPSA